MAFELKLQHLDARNQISEEHTAPSNGAQFLEEAL